MSIRDLSGKTLLDRYFLREFVGKGGMAEVYVAWDSLRTTKVAVKVLRSDLVHNPRFLKRFAKEAQIMRDLEHPNIVRRYEFERDDDDIAFLVMDYVPGRSLREAIIKRGRPHPLEETSRILQHVASALGFAHSQGIYHCDVKPANILLHEDGRVLLSDFGMARFAAEGISGGTVAYMAPEQLTDSPVDARTDVYALGMTLFEMLTGGELPYRGDSPNSVGDTTKKRIVWEHLNLSAPSPQQFNAHLPSAIENVVMTALERRPDKRFKTPQELRISFEMARQRISASAREESSSTVYIRPSRPQPTADIGDEQGRQRCVGAPHLLGIQGEMVNRRLLITEEGIAIGRSSDNTVRLSERSVSRHHAAIIVTKQGVYIRDLDSTLGTVVNGQKILRPVLLQDGDVIRIGYYQDFVYREM